MNAFFANRSIKNERKFIYQLRNRVMQIHICLNKYKMSITTVGKNPPVTLIGIVINYLSIMSPI